MQSRFHTFTELEFPPDSYPGVLVPQRVYCAGNGQGNWIPLPSITFTVNGTLGLRLQDALSLPIRGLAQRQVVPHVSSTSARTTLRIQVRLSDRIITRLMISRQHSGRDTNHGETPTAYTYSITPAG